MSKFLWWKYFDEVCQIFLHFYKHSLYIFFFLMILCIVNFNCLIFVRTSSPDTSTEYNKKYICKRVFIIDGILYCFISQYCHSDKKQRDHLDEVRASISGGPVLLITTWDWVCFYLAGFCLWEKVGRLEIQ